MLNKVIHYIWFGEKEPTSKEKKCINSWKRYFPDYKIIKWDENNFDVNSCAYAREAYENKKYAFVSDYARFKILYEYGGLYFDTDVEVISDMKDICEKNDSFMGFESANEKNEYKVAPGLCIYMDKKNQLCKEILDSYNCDHFILENGKLNEITVVDRVTNILKKYGLKTNNELQKVNGITIYPSDYFCPYDLTTKEINIGTNTKTIHWYLGSWLNKKERIKSKIGIIVIKLIGFDNYYKMLKILKGEK